MHRLPFIFCIGFNKCGTTTLHNFFHENRMPSVHNAGGKLALQMLSNCINRRPIFSGFDQHFRCFSDMEFVNDRIAIEGNWHYRTMARDYPGSLFIYNTRDMEKWLMSRARWVGPVGSYMERYKRILQTSSEEEVVNHWRQKRLEFEAGAFEFFKARNDFLVLDIEAPNCPQQIEEFLKMELNHACWRWENRTQAEN